MSTSSSTVESPRKHVGLSVLLVLDAAILFLLGALLIFAPHQAAQTFGFRDVNPSIHLIISLWGCAMATMAIGYAQAAEDPVRHVAWVQVGIARGALECIVGIVYVARGLVTFQQAGLGIVAGALIALAYLILYPRNETLPVDGQTVTIAPSKGPPA